MIYCLEDDSAIRELVVYTLNGVGLEACGFERPSEFWEALQQEKPQLLLLDLMLPQEDGLSILKKLRASAATRNLPVILLTAKGTEYDKVKGLDAGADDYVTKPFGMMELVARVKALLRRAGDAGGREAQAYAMDSLRLDVARHEVKVNGQEITLTLKEFEVLCLLMENRGLVMTRDKILDHVWGYRFDGESRTVDVHIRTLRQKLGEAGALIETVRGVGYKIGGDA
ncbi:MAG: response regulator transcription factor [Clostridiales bacterium]|nr:response regulator transcription factor [Clostridiales bacterium]